MKTISIIVLGIMALGLMAFFGWMGFTAFQQRQGPSLDSTIEPVFATRTPQTVSAVTTVVPTTSVKPVTATPEESAEVEPTVQPTSEQAASGPLTCGVSGAWNILIIGSDYADLRGQKGSDLTRMLRADFTNKKVSIYAFSRDLWVDTAGLGLTSPTIDATRLGMVFYEGRLRSLQFSELDTIVDGTRITARMISKNFDINTDHYLAIDLKHFAGMIDTIGGLPINIPTRTTDPWIGMVIEAGQQTLNGAQVVGYARAIPDSDWGRIQRNNILLDAIRKKLVEPDVMARIPELFAQYKDVMATDLSFEQISQLNCLLKEVPESSIIQDTVKPEWTSAGPQGSLLWNKDLVTARLTELGFVP